MLLTHDCDLAANFAVEDKAEVMPGMLHPEAYKPQEFGKNVRLLDLPVQFEGNLRYVRLRVQDKIVISKDFVAEDGRDQAYALDEEGRRQLQSWLAIRYRRHSLPNALNDRLIPVLDKILSSGKSRNPGVVAVFFRCDPANIELESLDDPYEVKIKIVYNHRHPDGEKNASEMARITDAAFAKCQGIDYQGVEAVSDAAFTLFDLRTHIEFTAEHLSFRGQGTSDLLPCTS